MAENIYTKYNIDKSKLKRDYILNPLKKGTGGLYNGEKPYKEDLEYLYISLNLQRYIISEYFNRSEGTIKSWCKHYNIHKNINDIHKNISRTNIKKYGSITPLSNRKIINKSKHTWIKKYGVSNPSYNKNSLEKRNITKIKNGTIGKSKEEDKIYELLKKKYPNTIHHYKSDLYPFVCDFYIPEIDTYIEYQGYWTHGGEPYVGTSEQKKKVKLWESKNTPQYNKAINDWTIRDPLKRKTAKDNGLNWIEFFNLEQIQNFL